MSELGNILNNCDTDSVTNKYGGTHLNNCVDWEILINATLPVPQQMTCMLAYVYLCLESECFANREIVLRMTLSCDGEDYSRTSI